MKSKHVLTVYLLLGCFFIASPLLCDYFSGLSRFYGIFLSLYALCFLAVLKIVAIPARSISVTLTDVLLVLYLGWGAGNLLLVREEGIDPLLVAEWASLALCYLLARGMPNRGMPAAFAAVVLSGCVQSIIGAMQWLSVIPSRHNLFPATGSFMNPGPYGNYLALCLVVGIVLLTRTIRSRKPLQTVGLAAAVLLTGCMTVLSDSRTAWLATALSIAYLFLRETKSKIRAAAGLKIAAIALLIAVAAGLYFHKKGSADARLLSWRVCCGIFARSPVAGNGIGSLASLYMDAQGDYFAEHPQSRFLSVAGNNTMAFNEYIRVACEQGCVGFVLFAGLFLSAFGKSGCSRYRYPVRCGLLVLSVVCFFSYPSGVYPLKIACAMFLGMARPKPLRVVALPAVGRRWIAGVVLAAACIAVPFQCRYARCSVRLENYMRSPSEHNLNMLREYWADAAWNRDFMRRYCQYLYLNRRYSDCVAILPLYHAGVQKTTETLCDLGNAYANTHQFRKAEECFMQARQMIPTRILPLYCLFRLYRANGRSEALQTARVLADFPVAIVNSTTIRIKAEVRDYLKQDAPEENLFRQ